MAKFKVEIGDAGRQDSWQQSWELTTECHACQAPARLALTVQERPGKSGKKEERFVTDLHPNEGAGGWWPHDCVAFAIYFCPECFAVTCLWNQA